MAVAIKKELLEDEERQQSKKRRVTQENSPNSNHQRHEDQNGHNDTDITVSNGHVGKGTKEHYKNNNEDPLEDREEEEVVDEDDLRRHEFRTHLFLASVSSHQKHHHPTLSHDPQDTSISNDSGANANSLFHVPCPLCQVPLEQRVFRQHLDRHYPRDSPVCPVIQCGRRFAHPNSVRNHMRLKHAVQWLKMKAMRSSGGPFIGLNNSATSAEHAIATTTTSSHPFTKQEFL